MKEPLLRRRASSASAADAGRANHQISYVKCPSCKQVEQTGVGVSTHVGPEVWEQAECDAVIVEVPDRPGVKLPRAKQAIPPAVRRAVMARDHHWPLDGAQTVHRTFRSTYVLLASYSLQWVERSVDVANVSTHVGPAVITEGPYPAGGDAAPSTREPPLRSLVVERRSLRRMQMRARLNASLRTPSHARARLTFVSSSISNRTVFDVECVLVGSDCAHSKEFEKTASSLCSP